MDRYYPALQGMLWHIERSIRSSYHWLRQGRWSVYFACLPLVVFAVAYALASPKAKPKVPPPTPSYVEQVAPGADFHQRFGDDTPLVKRVRTVPIVRTLAAIEPAVDVDTPPTPSVRMVADTPLPTERELRRRPPRRSGGDICSRHNMRKVITRGGKSWRCRR